MFKVFEILLSEHVMNGCGMNFCYQKLPQKCFFICDQINIKLIIRLFPILIISELEIKFAL